MALQHSHPAPVGVSERWLLTRSAAREDRLPGTLLIPEGREWLNVTRVILLIPETPVQVDRVVWVLEALDMPRSTPIVLTELAGPNRDSAKRRRFDTLVACVREIFPTACGERLYDPDWLEAMRKFAKRQDLLIAAAGQHLPQGVSTEQSLSQALLHALDLPVLEITGIFPPWHSRALGWIKRALFDLFPFLVAGSFFWVQTQISSQSQGWVSTFAIGATVIVEFAVIFLWSLFLD